MDMLCLCFESPRRGYLQHVSGKPVTAEQLARMTGCSTDEVSLLLRELNDAGVYSETEHGTIFSRRMARDEQTRAADRERKRRVRQLSGGCPDDVPRHSSFSSSSSETPTPFSGVDPNRPPGPHPAIEAALAAYFGPLNVNGMARVKAFECASLTRDCDVANAIAAAAADRDEMGKPKLSIAEVLAEVREQHSTRGRRKAWRAEPKPERSEEYG